MQPTVDEPGLKTVKRHAEVGERILIIKARFGNISILIDNQYTVKRVSDMGSIDVKEMNKIPGHWNFIDTEYEVIIEEDEAKTIKDGIDALVYAFKSMARSSNKSANQKRAETIQRAGAFVESKTNINGYIKVFKGYELDCTSEFIVNAKKLMVTVLLRGYETGKLHAKGVAKCMPDEVFNADIGKVIALCKALEIDIPGEFMYAVQPTNYAVGQVVTFPKDDKDHMKLNYRVDTVCSKDSKLKMLFNDGGTAHGGNLTGSQFDENEHTRTLPIIDDTNAEYWSDSSEPQKD